jgi:hypothetical protein
MKFMLGFFPLLVSVAVARLRTSRGFLHRHRGQSLVHKRVSPGQQESSRSLLEQRHPYYHTSKALQDELNDLSTRCPGMSLRIVEGGRNRSIDVVAIRSPGSAPVNKNFLLFGEHSRELISPESGLHFIRTLCGEVPSLAEHAQEVLRENEYLIVVNGNPGSRQRVEQGEFCLRTNPEGVDLNRNWDEKWQASAVLDPEDTNPGEKPFSEPETQVFKQLVEEYRPTTFLTVHSGTLGMYMPWAFDMEHLASRNEPEMMDILKKVDKDHCQCPFGAAGREVGYSCPGTCLDWVYDKLQTPYAFAFEIYTDPARAADLQTRWQQKMDSNYGAFLQAHSNLGHHHFREIFANYSSSFVQLHEEHGAKRAAHVKSETRDIDEECFPQFNPGTEAEYNRVVDNWSGAYLDMSDMVVAKLK